MSAATPAGSVIIPTWRRASMLACTLDDLTGQTRQDFEVIVASDGEDDATRALASSISTAFPLRWRFLPTREGPATARNRGVELASAEIVLFLDDDTSPAPTWVEAHLRAQARAGRPTIVAGALREVYDRGPANHAERCLRRLAGRRLAALHEALASGAGARPDVAWVGLNTSLPRRTFLAAAGYDGALRAAQEDAELAFRLVGRGVGFVFEPAAEVVHRSSKRLDDALAQLAYELGRTDVYRYFRKGQRSSVSPNLLAWHGRWRDRLRARASWRAPRGVRAAAGALRMAAELAASDRAMARWVSLTFSAAYWRGVREAGARVVDLAQLGAD